MSQKRENIYITLASIIRGCIQNISQSFSMLWKKDAKLTNTPFLKIFHFIVYEGPKEFWKRPTAIKIGRSISTLFHTILHANDKK